MKLSLISASRAKLLVQLPFTELNEWINKYVTQKQFLWLNN